jgi:intracellular sulfur oxidation DsrE/DsrF family protein
MSDRRTFLTAAGVALAASAPRVAGASEVSAAAEPGLFDRAAFVARERQPFAHRQVFASPRVADGAVLGFMANSLNAYDRGFGDPGSLHAAAVFYSTGVALALDDAAWTQLRIAEVVRSASDRVRADPLGNPFVRAPQGWTFAELQRRNASFFVCNNALNDLAKRCGTTPEVLHAHLLPGMLVVPAGVAALNALQEAHFTLFQVLA